MVVHMPGHPRANRVGAVLEHLLVAERALGRPIELPAQVHHVDEDTYNNAPSNLVICQDQEYHQLLHRRMRALDATGNPNALPCNVCGKFDLPNNMRVFEHRWKQRAAPSIRAYHTECKDRQRRANQLRRNQSTTATRDCA